MPFPRPIAFRRALAGLLFAPALALATGAEQAAPTTPAPCKALGPELSACPLGQRGWLLLDSRAQGEESALNALIPGGHMGAGPTPGLAEAFARALGASAQALPMHWSLRLPAPSIPGPGALAELTRSAAALPNANLSGPGILSTTPPPPSEGVALAQALLAARFAAHPYALALGAPAGSGWPEAAEREALQTLWRAAWRQPGIILTLSAPALSEGEAGAARDALTAALEAQGPVGPSLLAFESALPPVAPSPVSLIALRAERGVGALLASLPLGAPSEQMLTQALCAQALAGPLGALRAIKRSTPLLWQAALPQANLMLLGLRMADGANPAQGAGFLREQLRSFGSGPQDLPMIERAREARLAALEATQQDPAARAAWISAAFHGARLRGAPWEAFETLTQERERLLALSAAEIARGCPAALSGPTILGLAERDAP